LQQTKPKLKKTRQKTHNVSISADLTETAVMWISNGLFVEESFSGIPKQDYLHVTALNELNSIK